MNNESVKYQWQDQELILTKLDIKRFIATSPNVTDQEIQDFMWLCEYKKLNPFIKEAYLIKYGQEKSNIVTSKDVFDARADADPRYDGEEITDNYKRGMNLMDLWVRTKIFRKDCTHPVSDITVHYPEYVGRKKDGTINRMWLTKPVTMLTKVSKAQGKREANPKDMAGLYLTEEFDQEVKPTETVIMEKNITPQIKQIEDQPEKVISSTEPDLSAISNNNRPSEIQMFQIYGNVVCEECGVRVYGFKCPKCKRELKDLHVEAKGFIHSHYLAKADFSKTGKMTPAMLPAKLTKQQAMDIYDWWIGDNTKFIIGERLKREKAEKGTKPAKKGKLEVKDDKASFPVEDEVLAPADMPE